MTMLPTVYSILVNDGDVSALIATRVYRHGIAPQNVAAPYVTWFVVSGNPENTLSERPKVDRYEIQVDCWSNNTGTGDAQIEELAEAVRNALEGHGHMTGVVANEQDFETRRFRIGMQFTLFVHREQIVPPVIYALGLSGDESGGLLLSGDMADDSIDRELVS